LSARAKSEVFALHLLLRFPVLPKVIVRALLLRDLQLGAF
jgi:hypothetical protein